MTQNMLTVFTETKRTKQRAESRAIEGTVEEPAFNVPKNAY